MKSLSHFVLALGTCAAMASSLTHAAAFQNGSFELPGFPSGNDVIGDINVAALPGWVGDGDSSRQSVFYERSGAFFEFRALDGIASVGFGGLASSGGRISQTFDTVVGQSYTVKYFTTAQQTGSGAQSYLADVLSLVSSGGFVPTASQAGDIPVGNNAWVEHSFSFVAQSGTSKLRFADTSDGAAAAGINWALDAVSVTSAISVTPVPEPSTYAMMLLGLAATAGLARKKSAKAKRTEG
jgi:Protein of unknown function (DUF642)/PEP-CTERM motif